MLNIKTKQVIEVQDWDKLVQETYGKPYSFQQQDDCRSRGIFELSVRLDEEPYDYETTSIPEVINGNQMGVSFETWLRRDVKEWNGDKSAGSFLYLFWGRNFYPHIEVLAYDLCKRGLLPEGEYTINIDW